MFTALMFLIFNLTNAQTLLSGWKVIGPGGGGGVFLPTISPFDENLVLTHCDMTGAYISYNGGKQWRMFNLWTVPDDFEFDPVNANTIYAVTRGYPHSEDRGSGLSILYRSKDKGKHWRIIYPDVSKAKEVHNPQGSDLLPSQIIDGAFDGSIDKVEVDPSDNKKIYLGLSPLRSYLAQSNQDNKTNAMIIVSHDYGKTWKLLAKIPGQNIKAIFPGGDAEHKNEVLVFTENTSARIDENTGKITMLPLPVKEINAAEGGKNIIYIQSDFKKENGETKGGMYVSNDWGESWAQSNNGLMKNIAPNKVPQLREGFAVCENKPEVAYIATTNPVPNDNGGIEEIYCIFKTLDGGKNWEPVFLSSTPRGYITKNFSGSWMEKSYDPGWGGSPIDLGVAPNNPNICFAGDNGRGYKTTDGGKTWQQVYSINNPDGSYTSNGLDVTTCYGVHFDPFDKNHLFICYTDIGLFHSFNGGKSWFHSATNIPRDWLNTCYQVVFDPKVKGKVWSAWANAHDLPREKMFGNDAKFDRFAGGIAVSNDAGATWNKSNTGIPENAVCTNILLDTSSPVDMRTLYASVFGKGVYRSDDGGKTWQKKNNGFGENLFAWQLRKNVSGRLFVLFARGKNNGKTINGAIYYSDDNAENWKQLTLPVNVTGPHDLLTDPVNANIMYVSCWAHTEDGNDVGGGVIKTEDGGASWKQVFDERIRVNAAGMDAREPNKIFINTFHNAAYCSDDYGNTWKRIEGYRFKWGQRAIPDVNNPGMLYLTTYGGSVYYGPAEGIPNAFEDIDNMPKDWW